MELVLTPLATWLLLGGAIALICLVAYLAYKVGESTDADRQAFLDDLWNEDE